MRAKSLKLMCDAGELHATAPSRLTPARNLTKLFSDQLAAKPA
jgi:hypothetical protein